MSLDASCQPQKRTLSNLLAGRGLKKPKKQDCQSLQKAAISLLEQQQNLCGLLKEVGNPDLANIFHSQNETQERDIPGSNARAIAGSRLVGELRHQAVKLGLPVAALGVKMVLERLMTITETEEVKEDGEKGRCLLTFSQRAELRLLMEASKELLSQGGFCPSLLWNEYRRVQRLPNLELVYHLHLNNILNLKHILESDEEVRLWMAAQLKALCSWIPPSGEDETRHVQRKVISTLVGVLVGAGFEVSAGLAAADRGVSLLGRSLLDDVLFWLLDVSEKDETPERTGAGPGLLIQILDASLCGVSASGDALQRFFTHSLTQTLTYKPRYTVSDAVALQKEWTFARAGQLLTSLFRKLAVIFTVEQLLCQLQQVLEAHEVNWKHVLCFLSTLLVHNPLAQPALKELLSRQLTSAFESYDLENMITAFLLARQGALEGPGVFPSYTDWFKMSFSGSTGFHANNKKTLVFLLKFLSDLVPYEPSQYLKVHILHPPYVPAKHRSLLMEYVSLAKTRLADLKESVEDMGLYKDVSAAAGASAQCQAVQDVEKAVLLFDGTGKIPATVMEASIFRRPYFLTRFLPALLKPRVLPVKPDPQMNLIEALKKADKIPGSVYSTYVDSCQKQRQQNCRAERLNTNDDPLEVLEVQLEQFRGLLPKADEGEMLGQLSRISHTLSSVFPGCPDDAVGPSVIKFHLNNRPSSEIHHRVTDMILRSFCQCMLEDSRATPPNRQNLWASRFVSGLLGNTQFMSSLMHRIWDLLHNQGTLLTGAQLLGLAAFVVHLHASASHGPQVQLVPPVPAGPELVSFGDAFALALVCNTRTNMVFGVRFCLLAVCYGLCRGDSVPQPQQQRDYILSSFYKKLLHLIPRLLPEARRSPITGAGLVSDDQEENLQENLWSSTADLLSSWRKTAQHLWRLPAFRQLQHLPQYQLKVSEWLANELRIQRSEDVLSDPERQEYQQWACLEFYLLCPVEQGGCGGDMKILCSHLLNAIMDQHISQRSLDHGVSETGTCLPDILSRVQELVYEMEATGRSPGGTDRNNLQDFMLELVSDRCSSPPSRLSLHCALNAWNRVLLALPASILIQVKTDGGRATLDPNTMITHVNQHQRNVCSPPGLLPCHLTAHFLKGVLYASAGCGCPAREFDKAWSHIQQRCPLLLVSAAHWWDRLSPMLSSLWRRLCKEPLPQQLQLLTECQNWACSLKAGSAPSPAPAASDFQLAASLHRAWHRHGDKSVSLNELRTKTGTQHEQVLVFLFFLCVNDYLSALLYAQEKHQQKTRTLCSDLLSLLLDSADWLFIFKHGEKGVYHSVTQVVSDDFSRLMPWSFYSLLLQLSGELQRRAARCPGFLHTAVLSYIRLLQIYLDGLELEAASQLSDRQRESFQILGPAKRFLLRAISQTPPTSLSNRQLTQLRSRCEDADPEVAAALWEHLSPASLSPEMDFL